MLRETMNKGSAANANQPQQPAAAQQPKARKQGIKLTGPQENQGAGQTKKNSKCCGGGK